VVDAFGQGEILQVVPVSVLFGWRLQRWESVPRRLLTFIDSLSQGCSGSSLA